VLNLCEHVFFLLKERTDFVLMYAEADDNQATEFINDIESYVTFADARRPTVTVDKIHDIGPGTTVLQGLNELHDKYRLILVLVTPLLLKDGYSQFLSEVVTLSGLTGTDEQADRVIPVWMLPKKECKMAWLKAITGFNHFGNKSDGTLKTDYIRRITDCVQRSRKNWC